MEIKWELTLLLLFAIKGISGWWGQIYWSQRYGRYGINYRNWRGFWNDESSYPGYKRDSESKTITSGCIVDEVTKTLDCSRSTRIEIDVVKQTTFTYIPENAFDARVKEIRISNEELKTIHPKAFHNLVNLENLKIVSTKLNHIPDVSRCSKLKNLDLFDNAIEVYRHNVTNLPSSLEEVILISNKIYKFPVRYFNLPKLRYMGLALNVMEHFPGDAFGNVQALEYLGVDDNKIDSISRRELEPLMNSPSFRHLNISNNRINYIAPKALKVLKNLVVLELHNNLIVNLPKYALWRIPKLVHIDIDHNKIAVLTSNFITDCPELRNLYLHSQVDKMRSVYFDSLRNLTKLTQVYLGSNALAQFPHPVFSEEVFPSLSSLYLDNNQIPSLSDYSKDEFPPSAQVHYLTKKDTFKPFKNLPVLTTLDVKSNSIMEIKKTDLEYARSLQVLFIQGNVLPEGSIHEDAFVKATSLVTLDLSSQRGTPRIQYIPKALQKHTMPNLGTLLLYDNKITFILKGAFIKIPKLEYLSLSANQIVAIDDDAFPNSLSTLLLSSNKFAFTNYKPFFGLTKLESLNLQGNKIKVIPDVGLHGLERIKNLKLSANKIGRLKKIHFKDIKIMTELDFDSNDIAFIEDGTFAENRPSKVINYMLFRVNRVTQLPKTDFWNMHINILSFQFNRITKLHKGDFNNTKVDDKVVLFQNRIERIESYAVVNLNAVNFQIGGQQGNNPLQIIQQYAFVDVRVGNELDLSYHSVTTLESYSFNIKGIQGTLYVNNGQLKAIETFAFNLGRTNGVINLSKNKIETIARKIFVDGTTFRDLNLYGNKLRSIDDYAFLGSSMTGLLDFYQNELTIFPASAIKIYTSMKHLKMSSNRIEAIPAGSLDTLTNLQIFEMWQTDLKKIPNNLFINNAKLQTIKLEDNKITTLEDDYLKMKGNSDLKELRIDQNPITHVPKFNQSYLRLEKFWAKNVQTVSPELFGSNMPALRYFSLDTTRLECECFWYDTILGYLSRSNEYVEKTIQCQSPPPLRGFSAFRDASAIRGRKHQFICIPSNIVVSAPADYTIQLNYDYPARLYPEENVNLATDKLYFDATCKLENKDVFLTASVLNQKQITITGNDRVLAGRNYWCHMTMTYNRNNQGNVTSARSQSILITTLERKSKATSCSRGDAYECQTLESHITCVTNAGCDIDASNALRKSSCDQSGCCLHCFKSCIKCNNTVVDTQTIDITYYDFSRDDPDFAKSRYTPDIARPKFMASPYETWLANPAIEDPLLDSFSGWFQSITGRNKVVKSTITLSSEGKSDTVNNKDLFTFWDNDFWAVNGRGFTAEGQKDCKGLELINFGFTSAIRSGFIFGGGEHMQFAGGEDLWVYINKQLVVSIVIPQGYDGKQVICKTLHLQNTTTSGLLIPHVGIVDQNTRTCINTRPLMEEAVTINLKENIMYSLDIFHVERFRCTSEFLLATSGVVFAGTEQQKDIVDYIFEPPEDLHLKAIVGEFLVSDLYNSNSPYTVTVETGNSEDRYDIVRNSTQAHHDSATKPEATIYKNFTLNGEVIIVCPNNTNASANNNFEHTITSPQAFPNIDTKYALLLLKQPLDYETTSRYQLNLKVEDHGGRLGYITILILVVDKSDNCPIIRDNVFPHFTPLPPLQQNPLLTIVATDADSGLNGKISYVSQLISKIPTLKHTPFDNNGKTVWENKTVEWTIHVNLYAIDNGSPKRGDFFSISMSYAPSCDKTGRIVVNETSGQVFFAAPGMTTNDTSKFRYGEDQCYECTAGYFCPGNGQELNCVQNEETKHYFSYGFASSCSPCPEGWLCHNGILRKCAENTYVKCNTTWCPQSCFECQPGYYCYEGIRQSCRPGTFSKGKGPCQLCAPGSFSNSSNSIQCTCCPSGYGSTYEKTSCEPCQFKEFSTGECTMCKTCVPPGSCGCDRNPCYRSVSCFNTGESGASFQCGKCPNGYSGDGTSCQDVDECTNNNVCYNSACINMSPGFKCAGCPPGFTGNAPHGVGGEVVHERQFCRDINECENPELHSCDPNAECINTLGSYRCGKCKPGYVGDGYLGCKSGDYCATGQHNCHINATCIPLGSRKFTCVCKEGYAGNGQICGLDHDYDGVTSFGAACIENSCKLLIHAWKFI
uniref:Uncharacterized protein n=1 Tax=Clytia hemisphaerica TaxID=252671 RepID=A0A7M5WYM7_9CNID|eukprot:TCONS_00016953-protein